MQKMILRYFVIVMGCLISSSSINLFLVPNHLLSGGITGIAIIFYYLFDLPIGLQMLIYNVPLFFAAYKLLGPKYTIDVVFGTVVFSLCIDVTQFIGVYAAVSDTMLAAIYGGVFNGIGYGIIFRMNGSSGGLDIVAVILKKFYSFNMGGVIFAFNCIIMSIAAALFGVMPAMFTLISMFVSAMLTDKVVAGFNNKKAIILISDKTQLIAEEIIKEVGRGVTFLKGEGAFTHQQKNVLFVVVNLTQIGKIKMLTNAVDPQAFMIVLSANEVMGRGFTLPGQKIEAMLKQRDNQIAEEYNRKIERNKVK
jgi:uncharacterized membrane-anchored protein YitT (DUF2179 family)